MTNLLWSRVTLLKKITRLAPNRSVILVLQLFLYLCVLGDQILRETVGPLRPDYVDAVRVHGQEASLGSSSPSDDVFNVSGDGLRHRRQDRIYILNAVAKVIAVDLEARQNVIFLSLFFKNGPIPASFCSFWFFSHSNSSDKYTF